MIANYGYEDGSGHYYIKIDTSKCAECSDKGCISTCPEKLFATELDDFDDEVVLIREDAHILYGFFDQQEKEMFQLLLAVSGIGASTARVILSYMKPDELAKAILSSDSRALEGISAISQETAEAMATADAAVSRLAEQAERLTHLTDDMLAEETPTASQALPACPGGDLG